MPSKNPFDGFIDSLLETLIDATQTHAEDFIRKQVAQAAPAMPRQPKEKRAAKPKAERAKKATPTQTHYDTLEVHRAASQETISAAYRSLCQRNHPDKYPNDAKQRKHAEERMKAFTAAYAVLKKPESRKAYDRSIGL